MQPPKPRGLLPLAALPAPNVVGTHGTQTHEEYYCRSLTLPLEDTGSSYGHQYNASN
jgi:hypothetical protein